MTPRIFKDSKSRVWTFFVSVDTITEVLGKTGLDLRLLRDDHEHIARELDDPSKLKQVVAIMLEDQLEKAGVTVRELFMSIANEDQMNSLVMAVYQSGFDFFLNQGEVLNDALTKVMRAQETAQKNVTAQMRKQIDSGRMDRFLAIATDPDQAALFVMAAQNATVYPTIAAAWNDVKELPELKRLAQFIRLCVDRNLPTPVAPTETRTNSPSPSPNAGDSPESSDSIPVHSAGDSST